MTGVLKHPPPLIYDADLIKLLYRFVQKHLTTVPSGAVHYDQDPASPLILAFAQNHPNFAVSQSFFARPDGVKLRVAEFSPPQAHTTVFMCPGQNSPIEFHLRTILGCVRSGVRVIIYDPRSQGYSSRMCGPQTIHTEGPLQQALDMLAVYETFVAPRQVGTFKIMSFSISAPSALYLLLNGMIECHEHITVAPGFYPFELPLTGLKRILVEQMNHIGFSRFTPSGDGYWDYSNPNNTPMILASGLYSNDIDTLLNALTVIQNTGEMLRPGLPTFHRIMDMIKLVETLESLVFPSVERTDRPKHSCICPTTAVLAKGDMIVDNIRAQQLLSACAVALKIVTLDEQHALELAQGRIIKILVDLVAHVPSLTFSHPGRKNLSPPSAEPA